MFPLPEKIEAQLLRMRTMLARRGVAGFLATFPAAPVPVLTDCLKVLAAAAQKDVKDGAHLLGVHLEGPFLSKQAKGRAENAIMEFDPGSKEIMELFKAGKGLIKIMTFAPEQKFARELVKVLAASKIIPSLGHSATSYESALAFAELGALGITHAFNGMSGIHHRTPGVALAGLDEKFYKEVIVDDYHVHPAVVKIIWDLTPRKKFILITDLVGDEEPLDFEPPRLNNQTFAGSRLRLLRAVKLIKFTGARVPDAVATASSWPAKVLGLKDLGAIREGAEADLVLVDDKFSLQKIIFRGELLDGVSDV